MLNAHSLEPPPGAASATIVVRYVCFAAVSIPANLGTQEVVIRLVPIAPLVVSIAAGTVVGFVVKYLLDKRWIFFDGYASHREELRKVALYGVFSVATTLVFWGFEVAFWAIWHSDAAKYTGAVVGLSIGYAAKYLLDRTFVFKVGRG